MTDMQARHLKDYRAPDYTISDVHLTFELDPERTRVTARSTVSRLNSEATQLTLDGDELKLLSVSIDGKPCNDYQTTDSGLELPLPVDSAELEIVTEINPKANSKLEGLYLSDGAYCTQCEAEGFRRITYFLDRPDVLARYQVRVEAPLSDFPYLLSNGNLIAQGSLDGDKHYAEWQDPFPKPSYLFALVAGDFDCLNDSFTTRSGREVALQVFVDKGNLNKADHAMASLKHSMKWDEERFDLEYDLDIYMIVAVDFFNMGAMENKGLNLFNTKYVLADKASATDTDFHGIESVIGHEYFHNWTGNRVTCRDWFQLSLKEGLTVFRDQEFSSDLGSRTVNRIDAVKAIRNAQFAEDAGPMAHPIRPESVIEMNNFYTVTVYNKGAEVIRMMHTLLGESGFQAGMKLYFERYDGQAVTCDDFVAAMEDASGVDLTQFRRWYSQAGTPTVAVSHSYDAKSQRFELTLSQSTPDTADGSAKLPFHIPFDIELLDGNGKAIELRDEQGAQINSVLNLCESEQTFVFSQVPCEPVVSMLREFSAPVKLDYQFSEAQLTHLIRFASNEFSRWDAAQALATKLILENVARLQGGEACQPPKDLISAFEGLLGQTNADLAFVAECIATPEFAALVDASGKADVDALLEARAYHREQIGAQIQQVLADTYANLANEQSPTPASRALKNQCLSYLAAAGVPKAKALCQSQFDSADNMTDSLAALAAVALYKVPGADEMLKQFEQKWVKVPLVMDKWFALQGSRNDEDVLERMEYLCSHQAFSMSNPNRVYSLIGSFANRNPANFHKADGSGYRFLTERLIELNSLNPQVASRLITPLIQFQRFDVKRQELMKGELSRLLAMPDLAKDLYEKVSKALDA
ncbi:aminopeptidase N [Paraferrimonas sedimenticola]|uniref:Aminopeptidase N n=1 Tax=Paraferrimonas sedimenticola TaxID=375674 RepID=A0AA37RYX8_9GAMM|nr:aminopeptidase N [Paraferrimonas sedimenticola]GLP98070.1 aminopeptidase N [Paraferrimonas sedimenticola]